MSDREPVGGSVIDLDAIEARARRLPTNEPIPPCSHKQHVPVCFDCYTAHIEAEGPTFERQGRADVLALVAEVRRLWGAIGELAEADTQVCTVDPIPGAAFARREAMAALFALVPKAKP